MPVADAPPAAPVEERSTMAKAFDAIEAAGKPLGETATPPTIPRSPAQRSAPNRPENRVIRPGEDGPKPGDETKLGDDGEPVEDAPPKQDDQTTPPDEAAKGQQPKQKRPADLLREDREKQLKRAEAAEARLKDLEARHKAAEEKAARLEAAEKRLADMERRNKEIEDDFRLTNYERSTEYKEKYYKPYVDAYQRGRQKVTSLEVTNAEGESRTATPEDFDAIMSVTNDRQASRLAKEMFGDDAPIVIHHRERVLEANQNRVTAIEEAKKNGAEWEKQRAEHGSKLQESIRKVFADERKAATERHEWLKPVEGDDEWNKSLTRGTELTEKGFAPQAGETPEATAKRHAAIANRSISYSPMKLKIKRLTAELAEAKKALEQYQSSEPGKGEGEGQEAAVSGNGSEMDNVFAKINAKGKPLT